MLYDFQVKVAEFWDWALYNDENTLIDKSRDMGMSWLTVAYDVHKWMFVPDYKAGWASFKEMKVDRRGDLDAAFPRARFIIDNQPDWLIPEGFSIGGEHDNFMRLSNPENGSLITGEAGGDIGRGGRNSRYTLDEFAFFQHAESADRAVSMNTNCISYISTPNGMGNLFAQKRFKNMPSTNVMSLHWRLHPLKDDAWYAKKRSDLDETTLAQEVDLDYNASVEGVMIPAKWIRAAIDYGQDIMDDLQAGPVVAGLDVGETTDLSCLTIRRGVAVVSVTQWGRMNTTQTAYKALYICEHEGGVEKMKYDSIGIGAGVTGTLTTEFEDRDQLDDSDEKGDAMDDIADDTDMELIGVPWGTPAVRGEPFWDNPKKSLRDRFLNQRAADWWHLRLRFQATYEVVEGIRDHPVERLISINNDTDLISELSIPMVEYSSSGKIRLESKNSMSKRGIKSPNKADSLAYCFSTYDLPFILGVY